MIPSLRGHAGGEAMMGQLKQHQGQLFYSFNLEEAVPDDHLVRKIAAVLDLSLVRGALLAAGQALDRSRAPDPHAHPRLRVRHPLGTSPLPRGAGQSGLSVVLWLSIEDRLPDHSAFLRPQ
jgi:hypothetical protein